MLCLAWSWKQPLGARSHGLLPASFCPFCQGLCFCCPPWTLPFSHMFGGFPCLQPFFDHPFWQGILPSFHHLFGHHPFWQGIPSFPHFFVIIVFFAIIPFGKGFFVLLFNPWNPWLFCLRFGSNPQAAAAADGAGGACAGAAFLFSCQL